MPQLAPILWLILFFLFWVLLLFFLVFIWFNKGGSFKFNYNNQDSFSKTLWSW